jgi:transcriptional regulator GlxA family with amidase domain
MNSKLNHIQNWAEAAEQTKWSVSALAEKCGVSVRTLERHFLCHIGQSPKAWLAEQRLHQAMELLREGSSVKETASTLGYKHANNFSRKFPGIRAGVVETAQTQSRQAIMSQNDSFFRWIKPHRGVISSP